MIELSRTQDEEVGDGTTSVIVLGMLYLELIYFSLSYINDIPFFMYSLSCTGTINLEF